MAYQYHDNDKRGRDGKRGVKNTRDTEDGSAEESYKKEKRDEKRDSAAEKNEGGKSRKIYGDES